MARVGRGGGRGGCPRHYGPRGRSGLHVPTLVRGRPWRRGRGFRQDHQLEQAAQGGPGDHLGALVTAPRRRPAVRCCGISSWRGRASHSLRRSFWRLLRSRPRTLQAHGEAQTLGGPPGRTFLGTGGQSGTRPYLYVRSCPASTHLWLRQTPQSPGLQRQPQRTQAGESHTRPPPLAAQGGIGAGHRAGGCAGSVAGVVSRRWRRRGGWRLLPHQGVQGGSARGEGLRRAVWSPLPRWAQRRHWPQRERLLLRPRRERRVRIVRQRPRPPGWVALLRRRGQVGEEPGCHGG